MQADVGGIEDDGHVVARRRLEQIVHHFLLAIDHHPPSAAQRRHVDAEHLPIADQIGAVMQKALGAHPVIETKRRQHIHGDLFQHPGANAAFDIGAVAPLQHRGGDAMPPQQMRQKKARRARANDRNLGAHDPPFSGQLRRDTPY